MALSTAVRGSGLFWTAGTAIPTCKKRARHFCLALGLLFFLKQLELHHAVVVTTATRRHWRIFLGELSDDALRGEQ